MVNARIDAEDKRRADDVLASSHKTWSQAIQALAKYMRRTQQLPDVLTEPDVDAAAERQRKMDAVMSLCGIVDDPELATDEATDRLLYEEMMRRYG